MRLLPQWVSRWIPLRSLLYLPSVCRLSIIFTTLPYRYAQNAVVVAFGTPCVPFAILADFDMGLVWYVLVKASPVARPAYIISPIITCTVAIDCMTAEFSWIFTRWKSIPMGSLRMSRRRFRWAVGRMLLSTAGRPALLSICRNDGCIKCAECITCHIGFPIVVTSNTVLVSASSLRNALVVVNPA